MHSHRTRTNRWFRTNGQSLPMFVFFIIVLILFVGLGIDIGFAYITKANLSKAVDAACLEGMLNANQGTVTATAIARSVFDANYGRPGRDTGTVTPSIVMSYDGLGHRLVTVNASARINTFFIRVLPRWKTLAVRANAQAQSRRLIMSLVLDRSGSMDSNGGADVLPKAITNFVSYFDDTSDYVSMNSFASAGSTDVSIRHNFKAPITAAALAMDFEDRTCSECGMTNGLVQNQSVTVAPGDDVIKVIVFFTDGVANTFRYQFNCGARNISNANGGSADLYSTTTGNSASTGCTIPPSLTSIANVSGGSVNPSNCGEMHDEAEARALAIAKLARQQGNTVYSVGLGGNYTECGNPALNPAFLKSMANTIDSATYDASQPTGLSYVADDPNDVIPLFDQIRADILLRLTQ